MTYSIEDAKSEYTFRLVMQTQSGESAKIAGGRGGGQDMVWAPLGSFHILPRLNSPLQTKVAANHLK